MKKNSLFRALTVAALALGAAVLGFSQSATLTAAPTALAAGGGQITLTATANYDGQPGAVGWSVVLPADWALVSLSGPHRPGIAPDLGTTGTLEFVHTAVPTGRAEFSFVVSYPAGAGAAQAVSTVLLRANGKLTTLKPSPLAFGAK